MVSTGASAKSWFTYIHERDYDVVDIQRDELKRVAEYCLEDKTVTKKECDAKFMKNAQLLLTAI